MVPATGADMEQVAKLKTGQVIHAEWKKKRNYKFHQKWWSLVEFSFEHWEPGEIEDPRLKGQVPEKNLERFRKDLIILTGRFDASYRLDGSVRIEAKSISFSSMDGEEFEKLYSDTINVVLKHVLKNYDFEQLDEVVSKLMGFA
jgi:hypothetical protein